MTEHDELLTALCQTNVMLLLVRIPLGQVFDVRKSSNWHEMFEWLKELNGPSNWSFILHEAEINFRDVSQFSKSSLLLSSGMLIAR